MMNVPRRDVLQGYAQRYDSWYERHPFAYESEINALRALMPEGGRGLEVGVGTGRFAAKLGISVGLEPSRAMGHLARKRGIEVQIGMAERMPFADGSFDFVLMATTICYVRDIPAALKEAHRVLRPAGCILIGMLDFLSPPGTRYKKRLADGDFLGSAVPVSVDEVLLELRRTGFTSLDARQTIFEDPQAMMSADPIRDGHGQGLFVAIRGMKHISVGSGT